LIAGIYNSFNYILTNLVNHVKIIVANDGSHEH